MPDAIGDLRTWFDERKAALTRLGLTAGLKDSPPERAKRSAALTVATSQRIGQLVIWETGEAELSLGDAVSNEVVEEHREITSQIGPRDATDTLLAWLKQS